jgi:hypothetical protein
MNKHLMVLLIAAFAGLFQAFAEHVTTATMKEFDIREMAPGLFGWPRVLICRNFPDGTVRCCAGGSMPTLETLPGGAKWKAVCHREPV